MKATYTLKERLDQGIGAVIHTIARSPSVPEGVIRAALGALTDAGAIDAGRVLRNGHPSSPFPEEQTTQTTKFAVRYHVGANPETAVSQIPDAISAAAVAFASGERGPK